MVQNPVPPARSPQGETPPEDAPLAERLRAAPAAERADLLTELLRSRASSASLDWIGHLADAAEETGLSLPDVRRVASDLAWVARMAERRCPGEQEWSAARGVAGSRSKRLVLAYVHGQRLRFDYRFGELLRRCNEWLPEFHDDALVRGFAAFGALGSRAPNGLDLYNRAVEAIDGDAKSRSLCLTAIWFADHVEGSAEMLLELSNEMMAKGEAGEVVHYRRAGALRRLGRYDEALSEIDRTLELFGVGNTLVHEQYAQERRSILAAQNMRAQAETVTEEMGTRMSARLDDRIDEATAAMEARIRDASTELAQRVSVAQQLVSEGLLKMVEVLGLFVTLLGFLIGSGSVITKARTFPERAITMGIVVVGTVVFFVLLRVVVGVRRRRTTT